MDQGTEGDVESCLEGKADNESIRGDVWWGFLNMIHVLRVHWRGRPFLRSRKPSDSVQTLQGGSWALYSMQVYRAAKESTKPVAGGFWVLVIPYAYTYYIYTHP